jgi:2-polyprenyl-3-methyl-5-hydroxy-6-metoxy-1,4-benzoquinol methylase
MNQIQCKCCNEAANFLGNLDFACGHENKRITTERPYVHSDDVPYYLCPNCGFIFTNHMDNWSLNEFKEKIYHSTDAFIEKEESRKTVSYKIGGGIGSFFQESKDQIRVLDYGAGGNPGNLGLALIDSGFDVTSYEPFLANDAIYLKHDQYDLIVAVEVFEHIHNLHELGMHMSKLLSNNGLIWIMTLIHPHPTTVDVLKSWYITPSNGHISIFTLPAITFFLRRYGINVVHSALNPKGVIAFKNTPIFKNALFI